jgi:hypothetical protein
MAPFHSYIPARLWTPADLVDGRCWLDASDSSTITLSGSSISLWEDKIGSNDADDGVNTSNVKITTARPTIATADQNGLDAIAFNGSQWFDHLSATSLLRNRSCAIMAMVYKFGSMFASAQAVWSNRNLPTSQVRFAYVKLVRGTRLISRRLDGDQTVIVEVNSSPPGDTNWCVAIGVLDYAANTPSLRVNGTVLGTSSFPSGGANTSDTDLAGSAFDTLTAIGAGRRDGASPLTNGSRIGELVCGAKTSGSYPTSDIEQLEGYLAHKWGLASLLPSTHTYKTAAPTL